MLTRADASDPLYHQIAATLKKEIMSGTYPVGSQLPTESELCQRFAVSRYTVRCALGALREDGLISSRRGAGTVVIPPPSIGSRHFGAMSIEDILHFARGSYIEVQQLGMVTVDEAIARRTSFAPGEEWLCVQARGFDRESDVPLGSSEYFIHRDFAGVARLLERHKGPIFPLIEAMYGIQVAEVHQEIAATLIDPDIARRTLVEPGSPALEVRHSFRTANGRLAQLTINTHPAARYRHSVTMRRVRQEQQAGSQTDMA